ncbi:2-aminoethanethiol dioxygenase [Morus notabilis]|uniref:cysteine dioxygenase n=1 Tax=Morus notabilis TaxID=981085 RepID=W9R7R5_9ROSA|nr:2-aminoethanethiol dioxygenase [Morus notabilis]
MDGSIEKSKIQTLYEACSLVFSQKEPPSFQQIQWLKNLLGIFEAKDVGIDEFGICGSPSSSQNENKGQICVQSISEITYIHIHECDDFSIGVFCFPAGGALPLHDHPGMTVFSKVLYGSVYVKAYDWVLKVDTSSSTSKTCKNSLLAQTFLSINLFLFFVDHDFICWDVRIYVGDEVGLASRVREEIIMRAPCETSVLYPTSGGNIHSFTALTPCTILDVLTPPYSDDLGRPSTYFSLFPLSSLPDYVVLEERDLPEDLVVRGAPYMGPQIDAGHDFC